MVKYLIPLVLFLVVAGFLGWGLYGPKKLNSTQKELESMLVGKQAPEFTLRTLQDTNKTFSSESLKGKVWILNVWASWCVACVQEHKVLQAMAAENIAIYGLNYQDSTAAAKRWLAKHGDPYRLSIIDNEKVSLDYGVYGVPESFLIDQQGVIRHKFTGPISWQEYNDVLKPMLKELEG